MNKKTWIGIVIFVVIVIAIILLTVFSKGDGKNIFNGNLETVYVATGGGKEDFLNDENVQKILRIK